MLKLNRTTEYCLKALLYLDRKGDDQQAPMASAREISDFYGLPFEITAKTLQRLKDTGLIYSTQGSQGGYQLKRPLNEVPFGEFLHLVETGSTMVPCLGKRADGEGNCEYLQRCEILDFMNSVNSRIYALLDDIKLSELVTFAKDSSKENVNGACLGVCLTPPASLEHPAQTNAGASA